MPGLKGAATDRQTINRISGRVLIALSLVALVAVLTGYTHPPQADEGAAAHIFQLSIALCVPMILVFFITADWKRPWHAARASAFAGAILMVALGALYYLEHYR